MCTYMIVDVELFLQVLVFLNQLAPKEQRRLMEISQLNCQPMLAPQDRRRLAEITHLDSQTVVKRVQSRMVSSQVSLCVYEGLFLSMYSASQEC